MIAKLQPVYTMINGDTPWLWRDLVQMAMTIDLDAALTEEAGTVYLVRADGSREPFATRIQPVQQ